MKSFRRSMLFVPGNSAKMIFKSPLLGADSIILDLEDAVSSNEKDSARFLVKNALKSMDFNGAELIVRINSLQSGLWREDLEAIVPLEPAIIMPVKIQSPQDVQAIDAYMTEIEERNGMAKENIRIMPLLETALGIENSFLIAQSSKRISGLYLGAEDLTADLHAKRTKEGKEIFYSRSRIVIAARAVGLPVYDTPFTDVNDEHGLYEDAMLAKDMGFSGKAVISPRHVETVNSVFSPTEAEIEYARCVIAAIEQGSHEGKGAVSLNGKMIDAPIAARARQTMEMAELLKGSSR